MNEYNSPQSTQLEQKVENLVKLSLKLAFEFVFDQVGWSLLVDHVHFGFVIIKHSDKFIAVIYSSDFLDLSLLHADVAPTVCAEDGGIIHDTLPNGQNALINVEMA